MGIYTNAALSADYVSSDYTSVEPYSGSHFNFHELGIIAASECAANNNAFMKAIALNELAAYEQTGSTDIIYESVDIGGVIEKIKMFFKKIIEKIHKIFHTFVSKMTGWFGDNTKFVKKYKEEVKRNWGKIKSDWTYNGFKFNISNYCLTNNISGKTLETIKTNIKTIDSILNINNATSIDTFIKSVASSSGDIVDIGSINNTSDNSNTNSKSYDKSKAKENIRNFKEHFNDYKDSMRGTIIKRIKDGESFCGVNNNAIELKADDANKYDSSEYSDELYRVFRSDNNSPKAITKSEIETMYGSLDNMFSFIEDFKKIKSNINESEKILVKTIDSHINDVNKLKKNTKDDSKKNKDDKTKKDYNEMLIEALALYQSVWGAYKEVQIQAFSSLLQATKDACTQAKAICVKVIGMNKKMMATESYNYNSSYNSSSDYSFISSVKLV